MTDSTPLRRLVVKVGTSVLTGGSTHLDPRRMLTLVQQIAEVHERGTAAVLVSSGAVAAGRGLLNSPDRGLTIPTKQMLAAIGQPRLMHLYADLFEIFSLRVAQVLLTRSDFRSKQRSFNARDTITALLSQGVIPIINENDTIATDEIRLGDNDNLSALVANLIEADLLVLLTDQPGLFTTDPRTDPNARLISTVERIDREVWDSAGGVGSAVGTGGMITKLQAAQLATRGGTAVVIAQGSRPGVLLDLLGPRGHAVGTWFEPSTTHVERRQRWILSEAPQGRIHIDAGAASTLRSSTANLLPVGMTAVEGRFERGVVVGILGPDGIEVARGVTSYPSEALEQICGLHSDLIEARLGYTYGNAVVRRDYLVIL
ncbi:MAG: glutamate 5-kinase [Anaerolineae bacterium]